MNISPSYDKKSDPPLSLAILVGVLFIGLLFHEEIAALRLPPWVAVDRYMNDHPIFSLSFGLALAFDMIAGGSLVYGVLTGKRQGKNLEALSGKRREKIRISFAGISISLALGAGIFSLLQFFVVPGLVAELPGYWDSDLEKIAVLVIAATYALSGLIGCALLWRLGASVFTRGSSKLPPFPVQKNCIVLGSLGEEVPDA